MKFVVPIIILGIIALQFYFFVKNLKRMHQFRDIFMKKVLGTYHMTETLVLSKEYMVKEI